MNLSEFKAWFEGFTECLDGSPGPKAWERICEKVKAITPDATPWPAFVKEYLPYYTRWQHGWPSAIWAVGTNSVSNNLQPSSMTMANSGGHVASNAAMMKSGTTPLDAFRNVGRFDAEALT